MTRQKSFKRHVRERMAKTGERYTAARSQLAARRDGARGTRMNLAAAVEIASDRKLTEATGRGWGSWLTILDEWGARDKKHGETVGFLMAEHGLPGWCAQAITNGHERARLADETPATRPIHDLCLEDNRRASRGALRCVRQ